MASTGKVNKESSNEVYIKKDVCLSCVQNVSLTFLLGDLIALEK